MLTMTGQVLNVFTTPVGVTKEGKGYGGEQRVQLQGLTTLKNGERQVKLVTMTTKKPEEFRKLLGKKVQVEVAVFVNGKELSYFLPENCTIQALS
jgi:hypothetical protein